MINRKRIKQIETTRQQILSAAIPLLTQRGFETISMDEIAEAANVSRATLYNHFDDKAAILDAGFAEEFASGAPDLLTRALDIPSRRERLQFVFDTFAQWATPKKSLLRPVVTYGIRRSLAHPDQPNPLRAFFVVLLDGSSRSLNRVSSQEVLAHYLHHLYLAATLRWLENDDSEPGAYFSEMLSLFLDGAENIRTP